MLCRQRRHGGTACESLVSPARLLRAHHNPLAITYVSLGQATTAPSAGAFVCGVPGWPHYPDGHLGKAELGPALNIARRVGGGEGTLGRLLAVSSCSSCRSNQ